MQEVKIIEDSMAENGIRLTTMELTYPLLIHQELLTHRAFSRNSASNRAIKTAKMLAAVSSQPFVPEKFPLEQKGMSPAGWVEDYAECRRIWLEGRDHALEIAKRLSDKGVHKQIANRGLYAYLHITTVLSSTDWTNFYELRDSEFAQQEIADLSREMKRKQKESIPKTVRIGEWHLPYVKDVEKLEYQEDAKFISAGRSGRTSYLNQGYETNPESDIVLAQSFVNNKHWSTWEHPATPLYDRGYCGNFRGWLQGRKLFEEYVA